MIVYPQAPLMALGLAADVFDFVLQHDFLFKVMFQSICVNIRCFLHMLEHIK